MRYVQAKQFSPLQYSGKLIVNIFNSVKTIAVVSASPKPHCAGHRVMKMFHEWGYRVIPDNTRKNDGFIHGGKVYSTLVEIPYVFQMVDIFRNIVDVNDLADLCQSLEAAGKVEDWDVIEKKAPRLSGTIENVVEYINNLWSLMSAKGH